MTMARDDDDDVDFDNHKKQLKNVAMKANAFIAIAFEKWNIRDNIDTV